MPLLEGRARRPAAARTAYLCERFACQAPVSDPARFARCSIERRRAPAALSTISAAATFSSRWAICEVPGIGSITGERASSQASAIWPVRRAVRARRRASIAAVAAPARPAASGNHGMKAIPRALARVEHVLARRGRARCSGSGPRRSSRSASACSSCAQVDVGDADVADLAGLLGLDEHAERVLDRHRGVEAVELVEVDALDAQTPQAALERRAQVLRAPVAIPRARARCASGRPWSRRRRRRRGASARAISSSLTFGP